MDALLTSWSMALEECADLVSLDIPLPTSIYQRARKLRKPWLSEGYSETIFAYIFRHGEVSHPDADFTKISGTAFTPPVRDKNLPCAIFL